MTSVSVIVPTWRRTESLVRCLRALAGQTLAPVEIAVVTRAEDESSRAAARTVAFPASTRLLLPTVEHAGVVAALQAGLDAATGELIALTDDDAEAHRDWLERLARAVMVDARIAGAGGRDLQPANDELPARVVGRVQWFGRVVGAHHRGVGAPRDVDVLKGVNMAVRAAPLRAIGFDQRLHGAGAQQHWELALCLKLRRAGWRLVYDPTIVVDHHVEARAGDDQIHRGHFAATPLEDAVHNETLALLEHLTPGRRFAFDLWERLVGTVAAPGLLNALRLRAQGHRWAFDAWRATRTGRALARATFGARVPKAGT